MRIWLVHPKMLDTKGLVGQWREALLGRYFLEQQHKKYNWALGKFKKHAQPIAAINSYMMSIYIESTERDFNFDFKKIGNGPFINLRNEKELIPITWEELKVDYIELMDRLMIRDVGWFDKVSKKPVEPNPVFKVVKDED